MVSNQAPQSTQGSRTESLSTLIGEVFLSRVFPSCVFGFILAAKISGLARRLQIANDGEAQYVALLAFVLQQVLAIIFLAIVVILFLIRRPIIGPHSSMSGALVAIAGTFALMVPLGASVVEENTAALLISSALVLMGVGFSVASLMALGRCFGLMPEARGLVTWGPYARVRHPLYLAETISALGLIVATASLPLVGLFIVYCGLQYWRALNEERVLKEAFPEYGEYSRRTARFLPGIH